MQMYSCSKVRINYGIKKKCWFRINDGDGDGSEDTSCSLPQLFLKKLFVLFYH